MSDRFLVVRNPVVVLREESDDWAFLYNPDSKESFGINPTGIIIWRLIDDQKTITDIADECKRLIAEIPSNLAEQLTAFIESLAKRNLLELKAC